MKIGSLFSGVGGLELGLEWSGLGSTVFQVEFDPWCRSVLAKHWPGADRSVEDVRNAGSATLPVVDVICGGFPCQDVSSAGKQRGLDGERSGLWFEYLRVVDELRPRAVVVENVASGKAKWLCEVRSGLQALGYGTRALEVAARDVGAPHLRRRVFVLAMADSYGIGRERLRLGGLRVGERVYGSAQVGGRDAALPDAVREGREGTESDRSRLVGREVAGPVVGGPVPDAVRILERYEHRRSSRSGGPGAPIAGDDDAVDCGPRTQPGVGGAADGLPSRLDRLAALAGWPGWCVGKGEDQHPWEPPRAVEVVRGVKTNRRQRLKALGNAVVPQCGYVAGLALRQWMGELAVEVAA